MASSIINSDDGSVSGTTGLKTTGGDDGELAFESSGTEAMRIDSSGNVGIGTSSPGQKFQVDQTSNASTWAKVSNGSNGGGAAAGVLFANDGGDLGAVSLLSSGQGAANALFLRSLSTNPLLLGTNNTERMRIDSSGNVGIGTSSPGAYDGWSSSGEPVLDAYNTIIRNVIVSDVAVADAPDQVFRWTCTSNGAVHLEGIIRGQNSVRIGASIISLKATCSDGNWTMVNETINSTNMTVDAVISGNDLYINANKPGGGTSMEIAFIGMMSWVNCTFSKT